MIALSGVASPAALAQAPAAEQIVVTGVAPSNVLSVGSGEIDASHAMTVADALNHAIGAAFLSDTEADPYQQDLYYRGFDASPVLGTAQGLAVYENGSRINERFGDTVLWDLIPTYAIRRIDVVPGSDPLFGLNALGGAVAVEMKTGFTAPGTTADIAGGSFGRERLIAQTGQQFDDDAVYLGILATHDGGWRQDSPNDLLQAYADYARRLAWGSAGISLSVAGDSLNGNGANPVQDSRTAAFAISDTERNRLFFLQGRADAPLSAATDLGLHLYFRSTQIEAFNGAPSGFAPCPAPSTLLCDEDGNPLATRSGAPVPASLGGTGIVPIETIDTNALGASAELKNTGTLLSLGNTARLGASVDSAHTGFNAMNELGNFVLLPGGGGTNTISDGVPLGGPAFNVALGSLNLDGGFYAEDALDLTPDLTAQISGRLNLDRIALSDRQGTGLSGDHGYASVNPAFGLTWRLDPSVSVYGSASQSSRTPTAAELSCADPAQPCRFPLSFISDPGLRQVVARTAEFGAKGQDEAGSATLTWSADLYETRSQDDILFVSSGPLIGSGFFTNVGATRRRGAEASLGAAWQKFDFKADYSYVEATFRSALTLPSADNPGADANGNIFVHPGDRLPGIPLNLAKFRVGYEPLAGLHLALDGTVSSSRFFRGDEANLQPPLPGFTVFNASADYAVTDRITLYLEGENILDRHYATFGLYGDPTSNGAFDFTNPRFVVPAQPLGLWGGIRLSL
jgi:outer membrane receptor protein involved in Fe transport